MAERTAIAWTDATFNPWTGCLKVSPGCDHCYAEGLAKRNTKTFGGWTPGAERKRTSSDYWKQPRKWNRDAAAADKRMRVFCASMADVFDNQVPVIWREDLFELIRETPSLDWQLLTKRPQNIAKMLPSDWGAGYRNVWLGTTVENQVEADRRIPHLLAVPAAVRFLSCEPLLGPVDLQWALNHRIGIAAGFLKRGLFSPGMETLRPLDWIIVGGESGPGARPLSRVWVNDLLQQCWRADVPAFMKQVGSKPGPEWPAGITGSGTDPEQWPYEIRTQRFPGSTPTPAAMGGGADE